MKLFGADNTPLKEKSIFHAFSDRDSELDECGQNVLDCRNEVLFMWDNIAGCLLTQGTKDDCVCHQELRPVEQPEFDVKFIATNESGTRLALWSSFGVAILDLPQRFGPLLEFENGKKSIIVKLRAINCLELDNDARVLQVLWNPSSAYDSALTVLLSNNTLYQVVLLQNASPIKVSRVGCRPVSRLRTLEALGETAIDFCFTTLSLDSKKSAILLLRGNGDVVLCSASESDTFPEGQALPISPLPDDNYLNEACSILSLPGQLTSVIIGTSRGVVYHTVLVPLDIDQVTIPVSNRKYRLLVVESVVLDPGLLSSTDDFISRPMRLIADPGHSRRYIAVHGAGVHCVVLEVLTGVRKLFEPGNFQGDNSETFIDPLASTLIDPPLFNMPESIIEYLVCSGRPLRGYTVFPYTFICIDSQNSVIELHLRRIEVAPFKLYTPKKEGGFDSERPLTSEIRKPFDQKIEKLLQDSRVIPRLRFPSQDISQEQMLEIVVRIGGLVRKVTIPSYQQVRSILTQRTHLIRSMKEIQMQELTFLEEERASIQLSAETFAERVQTVLEEMEDQRERLQKIMSRVSSMRSVPSDAEQRMSQTLSDVESRLDGYSVTLEKLKKSRAYQDMKIQEHFETRQMSLNNKHATIIRESLATVGENISDLVRKLNEMNQLLGLNTD